MKIKIYSAFFLFISLGLFAETDVNIFIDQGSNLTGYGANSLQTGYGDDLVHGQIVSLTQRDGVYFSLQITRDKSLLPGIYRKQIYGDFNANGNFDNEELIADVLDPDHLIDIYQQGSVLSILSASVGDSNYWLYVYEYVDGVFINRLKASSPDENINFFGHNRDIQKIELISPYEWAVEMKNSEQILYSVKSGDLIVTNDGEVVEKHRFDIPATGQLPSEKGKLPLGLRAFS